MGKIKFQSSLIRRASFDDKEAITTMFNAFIDKQEQILDVHYFGCYGLVPYKTRSFVCLTDKRIATIQYGPIGQVFYQDAFIEEINSGMVYQPSICYLYIVSVLLTCTLFGIVLIPTWVRLYYLLNKSGMVWSVREGFSVYAFANRSRLNVVTTFWRHVANVRNVRIQFLKKM